MATVELELESGLVSRPVRLVDTKERRKQRAGDYAKCRPSWVGRFGGVSLGDQARESTDEQKQRMIRSGWRQLDEQRLLGSLGWTRPRSWEKERVRRRAERGQRDTEKLVDAKGGGTVRAGPVMKTNPGGCKSIESGREDWRVQKVA